MAKLDTLSQNYHYIHTECGLIRTVLNGLAEELEAPQRKLKQALEDAKNLKFTVHDDGSVDYPRSPSTPAPLLQQPARDLRGTPPLLNPGGTDPNQAKAQAIADHIGQALREANEIDGRYARVLAKLGTGKDLDNTDWVDVAQDLKDVRAAAASTSENRTSPGASPPRRTPPGGAASRKNSAMNTSRCTRRASGRWTACPRSCVTMPTGPSCARRRRRSHTSWPP
ncbi:hypothetical protein [Streptomyces cinnamoneus]|uniref:hypothetical protein n=1 Tax=Streptomyces cinnamoneus TaxID=53446 RepID=UPI001865A1FF|nr:hypothetical protein [Streptomyces cinnamoneus]